MRKTTARLLYLALLITVLMACRGNVFTENSLGNKTGMANTNPSAVQTITDATGTAVKVRVNPDRVVCLHLSCIDILAELDRPPVGIFAVLTNFAIGSIYFGDRADDFGKISGRGEPNLEQLLALEPDLILGYQTQLSKQRQTLEAIAPLYLVKAEDYTDAIANLQKVGKLLGEEEKATAVAANFLDKLATYKVRSPQNKTVMVMRGTPSTFHVATKESLVGSTLAELTPYPWTLSGHSPTAINWVSYSFEEILQVNPDVIFVVKNSRAPNFIPELQTNRLWQALKAVKTGKVYALDEGKIGGLTTGTRSLGKLLDEIMPKVYPDVFLAPLP